METIRLTNGTQMPIVGTGTNTYGKKDRQYDAELTGDISVMKTAIEAGYRHIDTAIVYRTEKVVGQGIEESGINRSHFFITSKIAWETDKYTTKEEVVAAIEQSLTDLRTDYIDLYLIHQPRHTLAEDLELWKILEEYVDNGTFKEIGVSNFNQDQLDNILENGRIHPACNQIQSNASEWNDELIAYCLEKNVVPVAWKPVSRFSDEAIATLEHIGSKYGKTWAQVALRYQLDRQVVVIPKSHNPERQKENLNVFDFKLTNDEHELIKSLH